eukprot:3674873-Rhodomonas_salina.1
MSKIAAGIIVAQHMILTVQGPPQSSPSKSFSARRFADRILAYFSAYFASLSRISELNQVVAQ